MRKAVTSLAKLQFLTQILSSPLDCSLRHIIDHMEPRWYNKIYSGAKVQHMWQVSVGISMMLVFVLIPKSIDYIMVKEGKKYVGSANSKGKFVKLDGTDDVGK
jgi:hypothetical protein